jgi:hypothetical protein
VARLCQTAPADSLGVVPLPCAEGERVEFLVSNDKDDNDDEAVYDDDYYYYYCSHTDACRSERNDCWADDASSVDDPCDGASCNVKPRRVSTDQDNDDDDDDDNNSSQDLCVVSRMEALQGSEWAIANLWAVLEPRVVVGDDVMHDLVRVLGETF